MVVSPREVWDGVRGRDAFSADGCIPGSRVALGERQEDVRQEAGAGRSAAMPLRIRWRSLNPWPCAESLMMSVCAWKVTLPGREMTWKRAA